MKLESELRQDMITGEWVVVAMGRARRPNKFVKQRPQQVPGEPKKNCPFESLIPNTLLVYDQRGMTVEDRAYLRGSWWVQVVPNMYPAFGRHGVCSVERTVGPYHLRDGVGFHEVVITRDHTRSIAHMTPEEVAIILRAYRERYLVIQDDNCVAYISIFHNHGSTAGASISHPHSQIIAIPVIPPDVGRSLKGSLEYFKQHKTCVHCTMIAFERKEKTRVIYENDHFIIICPYVSRSAFEIRIFPKVHEPQFEKIKDDEITFLAPALQKALFALRRSLANPDHNFFIHTAPNSGGPSVGHYHWHIEIIPKTAIWAGFEIGTGIEISTISPEAAAQFLRKSKG